MIVTMMAAAALGSASPAPASPARIRLNRPTANDIAWAYPLGAQRAAVRRLGRDGRRGRDGVRVRQPVQQEHRQLGQRLELVRRAEEQARSGLQIFSLVDLVEGGGDLDERLQEEPRRLVGGISPQRLPCFVGVPITTIRIESCAFAKRRVRSKPRYPTIFARVLRHDEFQAVDGANANYVMRASPA